MRNGLVILAITLVIPSHTASAGTSKREIYEKLQSTCTYWKSKYKSRKNSKNRTLMNDACTRADQFGGKHLNQTSSYKYKSKEGSTSRIMRAKETNKNREESDIDKIDNKLRRGNSPKETERLKKLRRELEK